MFDSRNVGTAINSDMITAYVYILQSLKNQRYYIGSTNNIRQRIQTHQSGGVKATRNLLPLQVVLQQEYSDIGEARIVEMKLKRFKRKDYIAKIVSEGRIRILGG